MYRYLGTILTIWVLIISSALGQWTEPTRIGIPGAYLYPRILAHGDTLNVVSTLLPGGDKVVYLRSNDAGETWGDSHVLSDTVNSTNAMFVRIVKQGQQIMVLWRSIMNSGPRPWNIGYALSQNNGNSWTEPLYVLDPGWAHILYFSASGSGPVVNVILSSRINNDLVFFNVRSTNFGQSWSEPVELFRAAQEIWPDQVAIDNMVHYVWSGRFTMDEKIEIYYMRSTDNGINWSSNIALSDADQHHSQLPAIDADDFGNVAVTWMDFKYSPPGATGDIFIRQSTNSGSYWIPENQLTFNHSAFGSDNVLDIDTIYVAWEDESPGITRRSIYYMRSTDNGASWGEPYWVDGTNDDSWNPALAASNGNVYVVWAENPPGPGFGLYFSRYDDQTDILEDESITPRIEILHAYPNPFNSKTIISYANMKGGEIEIYSITGQKIRTFKTANNEEGQIEWDARDALGNKVSTGVYFARARAPQNSNTLKLLYLK